MTRESIVRSVFEAATQGRVREVEGLLQPDMRFVSVVAGREFTGLDGLEAWFDDVSGYYEDLHWEILEIEPVGERDAVRWRFTGRSRRTGVEFDTEMSQLWAYRDGRVARVDVFPDAEGALHAAAAEPPP